MFYYYHGPIRKLIMIWITGPKYNGNIILSRYISWKISKIFKRIK